MKLFIWLAILGALQVGTVEANEVPSGQTPKKSAAAEKWEAAHQDERYATPGDTSGLFIDDEAARWDELLPVM
jgi:hypothetical protein